MCEDMSWTIKKNMGRKRLRSAIKYVLDQERNSQQQDDDDNDNTNNHSNNGTGYNSRILEKAKEALFLQDRAMILKYRIAALRSRQCRSVDNKQYCPEAFLNIIAEKLTFNVS
jgi:hypothetical protein